MPHILKTELPDILDIAKRITNDCVANGPNFDEVSNFATASSVVVAAVSLQQGYGRYDDLACYSADSSIKLTVPRYGWDALKRSNRQPPNKIVAFVASAIAHELVHERHKRTDPAAYTAVVNHQSRFIFAAVMTPKAWYDGYYLSMHEREGHATQAAVDLWAEADLQGLSLSPTDDPMSTEALRRAARRLGVKGNAGDPDIDLWWDDVLSYARADIMGFI